MLFNNLSFCYIILYLFVYNLSLYIMVNVLIYFYMELKTLNLLNKLNNMYIFRIWLIIILFSIAGIPPFFGFFLKLTLLYYININSFLISLIFTFILLVSLYFYLQNIRYFMWLDNNLFKNNNWNIKFIKTSTIFINLILLFIICYGFLIYDDLLLLVTALFM